MEETEKPVSEALASADIVVSEVPVKSFKLAAEGFKPGAICINVSQHMNFGDGIDQKCALVPTMGKVTISILAATCSDSTTTSMRRRRGDPGCKPRRAARWASW